LLDTPIRRVRQALNPCGNHPLPAQSCPRCSGSRPASPERPAILILALRACRKPTPDPKRPDASSGRTPRAPPNWDAASKSRSVWRMWAVATGPLTPRLPTGGPGVTSPCEGESLELASASPACGRCSSITRPAKRGRPQASGRHPRKSRKGRCPISERIRRGFHEGCPRRSEG